MKISDPSLGIFSYLPGEIRAIIWKYLSPALHVRRSLPTKANQVSRDQRILCTSRKIYEEISAEVPSGYNDDDITIYVTPEYQYKVWLKAENTKGVRWMLESQQDAISRGFCDLPWHTLAVRIWIFPPKKDDSAQLICLFNKVRGLVEILRKAEGFRCLWVIFGYTEETSWFDGSEPQCSIRDGDDSFLWAKEEPWMNWDYDFIYPQFAQLRNARVARMYSADTRGLQNQRMTNLFLKTSKIMRTKTPFGLILNRWDGYDDQQAELYFYRIFAKVERILDNLPTKTANMLRLDRFSTWYSDKLFGNSLYENHLKRLAPHQIEQSDVLYSRYISMRAHNPLSLAFRTAFPSEFKPIETRGMEIEDWSRDAWHCVYKDGIPPLNSVQVDRINSLWLKESDYQETALEAANLASSSSQH